MSDVTLKVNTGEFERVASALLAQSSRSFSEFANGQMFRVATLAIKKTAKADSARIEQVLRTVQGDNSKIRKGDWQRLEGTFAARIINARRRKRGEKTIWGRELGDAVNKLVAARKRSAAFIKSGWIPAIQKLASVIYSGKGIRSVNNGARIVGQPKGYASPSRPTRNMILASEIGNTALLTSGKFDQKGNPIPVALPALQEAIKDMVNDMAAHFYKKTGEDLKPYGVSVA